MPLNSGAATADRTCMSEFQSTDEVVLHLVYPNGRTATYVPPGDVRVEVGTTVELFGRRWKVIRHLHDSKRRGSPSSLDPVAYECRPVGD
jgi:hypothetical protein